MKITLRTAAGKVLADFTIKTKRDHSQFYDAFSHMCHYQKGAAHPPGSSREEAAAKVRAFAEEVCQRFDECLSDWTKLPD